MLGPMLFQRLGQPFIELYLFSISRSHQVRLSSLQTLRRSQANKIFRGFDFVFEMLVLRFDVIDRFLCVMLLAVADESRI